MSVPGLGLPELFMRVRAAVIKQTNKKQVPWEASSLVGTFYLNDAPNIRPSTVQTKTSVSEPTTSVVQVLAGPRTLQGARMVYAPKDQTGKAINLKFRAKIVYFNEENALSNEVAQLDNDSSHVSNNQWYYWRVPSEGRLLLSWHAVSDGLLGWVLVEKSSLIQAGWSYRTNNDGQWKSLTTGVPMNKYWMLGTIKVPNQCGNTSTWQRLDH